MCLLIVYNTHMKRTNTRASKKTLAAQTKYSNKPLDKPLTIGYNTHMKTIDYTAIDTFTLSQEDVMNRPLRDRLSYALHQTALAMQLKYSCSYGSGMSIAKDSLTSMKVVWI